MAQRQSIQLTDKITCSNMIPPPLRKEYTVFDSFDHSLLSYSRRGGQNMHMYHVPPVKPEMVAKEISMGALVRQFSVLSRGR